MIKMKELFDRLDLVSIMAYGKNNDLIKYKDKYLILKKIDYYFDDKKECPKCYFHKFNKCCYDYYSSYCGLCGHFKEINDIELLLLKGDNENGNS